MKYWYHSLLFFFLFFTSSLLSQTVYEPLHSDVYKFLSRLAQKGVIEFDDQVKPVSREYIAEKLASTPLSMLNSLEKEELEFYLKDYGIEFSSPQVNQNSEFRIQGTNDESGIDSSSLEKSKLQSSMANSQLSIINSISGRWRLFSYSDSLFKINISPILGYELGSINIKGYSHRWNGVYMYGYLSDNIGFSFDFRDNREAGDNADRTKSFSPVTGINIAKGDGNAFEYSEAKASLTYNWSWGRITAAKDFLEWGYGESGKLVLSQKAPSFPFIRLDVKPVEWLKFNYIHAWLASDVVDSNEVYSSLRLGKENDRILYREKFLASHSLTLTPTCGLDVSIGESIIYSDRLEISYLIPIMFFRLADHYLSHGSNNAGGNAQFFGSISSRNHIPNTHLYGTLFIDEISTDAFGNSDKERNQFGFSLGSSVVDLPINNLTVTTEFTKIFPFVYKHYIPTQTYTSSSYQLGHWIGHNADMIYCSLNYRILRGLQVTAWMEYIRKGEDGKPDDQYTQPQPPFLFGLDTKYSFAGLELKYELIHELTVRARYNYNQVKQEQVDGSFVKTNSTDFYFAVYYGL